MCISILAALSVLMLLLFLPETLPYTVYKTRISQRLPDTPNPFPVPTLGSPLVPLSFFRIPSILLSTLLLGFVFSSMFMMFVILPVVVCSA